MRTIPAETEDQPNLLVPLDAVIGLIGWESTSEGQVKHFADKLKIKSYRAWDELFCVSVADAARLARTVRESNDKHRADWFAYVAEKKRLREEAEAKEQERRRKQREEFERRQAELTEKQRAEAKAKADLERVEAEMKLRQVEGPDFDEWLRKRAKAS